LYVPYRFVLHTALANAIGNKSLLYSKYEAFRTVKQKEMVLAAEILTALAKKGNSKKADMQNHLLWVCSKYANGLKYILYMRLALKTWIR
jgi:hypothetical protein